MYFLDSSVRPIDDSAILTSVVYLTWIVISAIRFQSLKQAIQVTKSDR